jgi:multiple sugar transport system substrate-binding protein
MWEGTKKIGLVVISILICLSGFSQIGLSQQKVTLKIAGVAGWTPCDPVGISLTPMFKEYSKQKLGYEVDVVWDLIPLNAWYDKEATALAAHSSEYDILFMDSQWLGAFSTHLVKLNKLIEEDPHLKAVVESFYPQHRDAYMTYPYGTPNYWGLPMEGDDLVMYIREDLLNDPQERANFKAKYGQELPKNYEDFRNLDWFVFEKVLEFFTRPPELYGLAYAYSKDYDFISDHLMSLFWTWGGDIINWETHKVEGILNSSVNVRALEYDKHLLRYCPPGAINFGNEECITNFALGKVFASVTWAAIGQTMFDPKTSKVYDKAIVVMPPGHKEEDGKWRRIYCIGGQPWGISKYSKHQKETVEFLKWWYSPEIQWEFAKRGGNPIVRGILDSEEFKKLKPWARAYVDMIPHTKDFWHLPCYAEMLLVQQEEWHNYIIGVTPDVKKALDKTAERQEEILRDWEFLK